MRWEQVPPIALFEHNTAAFVHDLEADALSNVAGDSDYVRVQVLTPAGVLDRATRRRPEVKVAYRVAEGGPTRDVAVGQR